MAESKTARANQARSITRLTNEYFLSVGDEQWGPLEITHYGNSIGRAESMIVTNIGPKVS